MRENTINILSKGHYHSVLFDTKQMPNDMKTKSEVFIIRDFMDRDYTEKDHYESQATKYTNYLRKNWDNVDFFEEKFDELKEKEMNNTLTEFEEQFLYKVVEKRLLDFENPFLPKDHEELMKTRNFTQHDFEKNGGLTQWLYKN